MQGVFTLTPPESKRLIAKGVAALPAVRRAKEKGRIIVAGGTTNAFIAEELGGKRILKCNYTAGIITDGVACLTPPSARLPVLVMVNGKPIEEAWDRVLANFDANDVFIKGANAVDPEGFAGVLMSSPLGGTIGAALGILQSRGSHLIVPVGLEKMITSVVKAARAAGIWKFDYALGQRVGLMPLVAAEVVTELKALEILTGVEAISLGSGGVGGSEGSVVIAVSGTKEQVVKSMELATSLKGEKEVGSLRQTCPCDTPCDYGKGTFRN